MTEYLGDGIYASFVKGGYLPLKIYTSDGIDETNILYFEPQTLLNLLNFIERIKNEI